MVSHLANSNPKIVSLHSDPSFISSKDLLDVGLSYSSGQPGANDENEKEKLRRESRRSESVGLEWRMHLL